MKTGSRCLFQAIGLVNSWRVSVQGIEGEEHRLPGGNILVISRSRTIGMLPRLRGPRGIPVKLEIKVGYGLSSSWLAADSPQVLRTAGSSLTDELH